MINIAKLLWLEAQSAINYLVNWFATLSPPPSVYLLKYFQWKHGPLYSEQKPIDSRLVFINFSWWTPFKLSMVKNNCFNTISVSPVYLFLASPDTKLAVAPGFTLVTSAFESLAHTVLPAIVIIQLKSRTLLNCQCNQKKVFQYIISYTPHADKDSRGSLIWSQQGTKLQDWHS